MVALRYGDSSGVENVPVGCDPAEPVLLGLEVLREVFGIDEGAGGEYQTGDGE